jgi:hypothetical protein
MNTVFANLKNSTNLTEAAKVVNNGRNDGIFFYVNGSRVSVASPYVTLSEAQQLEELNWFLKGKVYDIQLIINTKN